MSEDSDFLKLVMTDDPVTGDDLRAKASELASLDMADYLVCRKGEASALSIGAGELDKLVKAARGDAVAITGAGRKVAFEDPDPWSESVDGPALANAMAQEIKRYCAMGDHQVVACALWSLHAHAHDFFNISPVLGITSPQKECGKSTAMDCISCLTPR